MQPLVKRIQKPHLFTLALLFSAYSLIAQPTIISFAPQSGAVGTAVTISGTNFNTTPANNIVFFGAVRATLTAASGSPLTVTGPAGATYQPISVTVNNHIGFSAKSFILTFPGGSTITQFPNVTNNTFGIPIDSSTDLHPNGIALVDFDGDGRSLLLRVSMRSFGVIAVVY